MSYSLAPILLFVYNRPSHTEKTIATLSENLLAKNSELFIYSDAAKNNKSIENVNKVRVLLKKINQQNFKKITIIERKKNWGLAENIIDGVTHTVNQYGKVIVLEDDLVTSPHFLDFMNDSLNLYQDDKEVWHISGWNYPIKIDDLDESFLWRCMNCWSWATWKDKWNHFEKNTQQLLSQFTKSDIKRFNLNVNAPLWSQVLANKKGFIDTWAIYWYATIFKHNGLCLNPSQTLVENIGLDGSGINCGIHNSYDSKITQKKINLTQLELKESPTALSRIQDFYKLQNKITWRRIFNGLLMLKRIIFK